MGAFEAGALASVEATMRYHYLDAAILTYALTRQRTVVGGQFDWGGRLPKSNGGAPRFLQHGWKSCVECNSIKELDCETYKSNRDESRI